MAQYCCGAVAGVPNQFATHMKDRFDSRQDDIPSPKMIGCDCPAHALSSLCFVPKNANIFRSIPPLIEATMAGRDDDANPFAAPESALERETTTAASDERMICFIGEIIKPLSQQKQALHHIIAKTSVATA